MGSDKSIAAEMSSASAEHYTPADIVERARRTMGGINLDPASCHAAQETVRAAAYYTEALDGLSLPWSGRVFCNPPGDKSGKLPRAFWTKLRSDVSKYRVTEFVWVAFNISHLRTLQGDAAEWSLLEECDVCIPASRIRFTGGSPTKDNAILYWGPNGRAFSRHFRSLGTIWKAAR